MPIPLPFSNVFIMTPEEVEAMMEELQHTNIAKSNEVFIRVLVRAMNFLKNQEQTDARPS
jgi:hypothetical protein